MPVGPVGDDEVLWRSIRLEFVTYPNGRKRLSSQAFNDAEWKPSVDRANLRANPSETRLSGTDGIAQLLTSEVRDLTTIVVNPDEKKAGAKAYYKVDVVERAIPVGNPDGLPENPAHAQVEVDPKFANASRFNKLKDALCRLAESRDWVIEPKLET